MLRLRVFGGVAIERQGVSVVETAEMHKKLALLVLVAASGDRGISRDQLAAYLWPESQSEHARAALSQTLYTLRKHLADPALFIGTGTLRLNPTSIGSDVRDFKQALERKDWEAAVDIYSGAFLQGFFVSNSVELEHWIESERADLARQCAAAIESLARRGSECGDHATSARWWRRLTGTEPGNSRAVAGLVASLAATGDRAGALQVAHTHEAFLRSEFDAPPDPAVSSLVKEIRNGRGSIVTGRPLDQPPRSDDEQRHLAPPNVTLPGDVNDTVLVGGTAPQVHPMGGDSRTRPSHVESKQSGRARNRRVAELAVIGTLVGAVAIGGVVARQRTRHAAAAVSERRIAVTAFRNETGDTALASVGRIAVDWVIQGLVQTQLVEVVAPGVREGNLGALGDSVSPNAGLIVRGSYSRTADSLVLLAQIVESASGRVVRAVGPVSGPLNEPLIAVERLRQRLAGALATRVDPRLARWSDAASQPASFEAYRLYDAGLTEFFGARDSAGYARSGRLFVRAAAIDSAFSTPLVWASYAFNNCGDVARHDSVLRALDSRREWLPRLDRALLDAILAGSRLDPLARHRAFRRVVAIAPNSEWVYKLAEVATELHRFAEVDSLLSALDPDAGWIREWTGYWQRRSANAYEEGRHEQELAFARRDSVRNPGEPINPYMAGRALAALGRKAELLTLVDEALESTPPRVDSYDLFRILSAARLHEHRDIAEAIAQRALRRPVTGIDMVDSTLRRVRFELMVFEALGNWNAAATSARQLIGLDSLRGHHDALPYIVLLEIALRSGASADTAGLEAKALAEAAARSRGDGWSDWLSEHPLVARAELAALRGDAHGTAAVLWVAVESNLWDPLTEWAPSERSVFDRVRGDSAVINLLHAPALDRRPTRQSH